MPLTFPPGGKGLAGSRLRWATVAEVGWLTSVTLGYLAAALLLHLVIPRQFQESHFSQQAAAWLQGRLDLPHGGNLPDIAMIGERAYLTSGPLPSILLLPAVWRWGEAVPQAWLAFAFTAVSAALLWRCGRQLGLKPLDRWWLITSYLFGSVYLYTSLIPLSPYLGQLAATAALWLVVTAVLAAVRGADGAGVWPLVGFAVVVAGLARPHLVLLVLPLLVLTLRLPATRRVRLRRLAWLILPAGMTVVSLATYNAVRFGSWLEVSYRFIEWPHRGGVPSQLFSPRYLPVNLYYLFLALPEPVVRDGQLVFPYLKPDFWGLSIAITSPVLGYLLYRRPRGLLAGFGWLSAVAVALPVLTFFGIGFKQVGYRYALDFLPFLYLLVLLEVPGRLPPVVKGLMLAGVVANGWMVFGLITS